MVMKESAVQDERIILEKRKIQSGAYVFVVLALTASMIVQKFFLNAGFSQIAAEFLILIGCGLFNLICHVKKGLPLWDSPDETGNKKGKLRLLLDCALTAAISMVLLIVLSGEFNVYDTLLYFICFTTSFYLIRLLMIAVTKKRQRDIDRILDLDGQEDL